MAIINRLRKGGKDILRYSITVIIFGWFVSEGWYWRCLTAPALEKVCVETELCLAGKNSVQLNQAEKKRVFQSQS